MSVTETTTKRVDTFVKKTDFTDWCAALRHSAKHYPERCAIVHGERELTYRQFARQVDALALDLVERGVSRGDRVVILLADSPELLVALLATNRAGGVAITPNLRMPLDMIRGLLQHLEPRVVIAPAQTLTLPDVPALVAGLNLPHEPSLILAGSALERALARPVERADRQALDHAQVRPIDDCLISYSSGTTGQPKGIVHVARTLIYYGNIYQDYMGFETGEGEVFLSSIPLAAYVPQAINLPLALAIGATTAIGSMPPRPAKFLQAVEQYQATFSLGAPAFYLQCLKDPSRAQTDVSSLSRVIVLGAPVTIEQIQKIEQAFGALVYNLYGAVEASGVAAAGIMHPDEVRWGTLPVYPDALVEIRDPDGNVLEADQIGRIFVKSPGLMRGYYKQPEKTAEVLSPDGWYDTRDLGKLDQSGHLHLYGRADEAILRGGNNVYPCEVEQVLENHPGVQIAAVIGVKDPVLGEVPVAFVIPAAGAEPDPEALVAYCRSRMMPYYVPKDIHVRDTLPMTPSGKVRKFALREEFSAR